MDTDGCVYFNKRDKRTYIQFTNASPEILGDFKQMTNTLGIKFVKSGNKSVSLYRYQEIEKYIKRVGFSNEKHRYKIECIHKGL